MHTCAHTSYMYISHTQNGHTCINVLYEGAAPKYCSRPSQEYTAGEAKLAVLGQAAQFVMHMEDAMKFNLRTVE